jgi:hypothetical protein
VGSPIAVFRKGRRNEMVHFGNFVPSLVNDAFVLSMTGGKKSTKSRLSPSKIEGQWMGGNLKIAESHMTFALSVNNVVFPPSN